MSNGEAAPICPCEAIVHPTVVFNPPGRSVIAYRAGDYTTFHHALLLPREDESELSERIDGRLLQIWRPTSGDLALQMIEWWAYLADILTFYNERVASEAYLRTAELPESVNRLIQVLGYRPRPAIAATGVLAALVNSPKPITLSKGFQIQSKPGPGKQPQVFELSAATRIVPPDAMPAVPPPVSVTLVTPGTGGASATGTVLIAGTTSGLKAGDELLLLKKGWNGTDGGYAVGTVQSIAPEPGPSGAKNTKVVFTIKPSGRTVSGATAANYRLLKSSGTAALYQYPAPPAGVIGQSNGTGFVELASIFRQIAAGDPIVIDDARPQVGNPPVAASVTGYQELVYYANNPSDPVHPPVTSPPTDPPPAIPIPHTRLSFALAPSDRVVGSATTSVVRFGWRDVGTLIDVPATTAGGAGAASATTLQATPGQSFPVAIGTPVLIEDANSDGSPATIENANTIDLPGTAPTLTAPLRALFNLLAVSRGKTVPSEVLGSGNAAILGQDFTLQNAPVTYLQDAASASGANYSSTVKASVNGVQWPEVTSFYGLAEGAEAFMTREDEQGKTHVVFASRLPTGVNNIVASYRYGAGAEVPAPGTLTVVLQPQPGLRSIRNPVAPGGGSDADPPDKVRRLAPRSVLTFNRAVSLEDYEVIAGSAPGVRRAKAAFSFDAAAQRPSINIWVGDDSGAVAAARAAITGTADPNRPVTIALARQLEAVLSLTYLRDPRYDDAKIRTALHDALIDPDHGLFGVNVVAIGEAFYDSQIYSACLAVPGVQAVQNLSFSTGSGAAPVQALAHASLSSSKNLAAGGIASELTRRIGFRPVPVRGTPLTSCRDHRFDPGPGGYFFVADDSAHLILNGAVAS